MLKPKYDEEGIPTGRQPSMLCQSLEGNGGSHTGKGPRQDFGSWGRKVGVTTQWWSVLQKVLEAAMGDWLIKEDQ